MKEKIRTLWLRGKSIRQIEKLLKIKIYMEHDLSNLSYNVLSGHYTFCPVLFS